VSRVPVLVNAGGGTASAKGETLEGEVRQAFAAVGIEADVRLLGGGDLAAAVTAAANAPLLVVGGGDGTLSTAAGALLAAGGQATLGLLPLGTHNHLARDLGIPLDLAGAARVVADGHTLRIDVARVNGRVFLNNASVGIYPALVLRREALRRAGGGPKWRADLRAAWTVLKRARHHRLRLVVEGRPTPLATPLLFVGNNRYGQGPIGLGRRASLRDGVLSVMALGRSSRFGLVRLALRTLAGRTHPERDLAAVAEVRACEVHLRGSAVELALDGEVVRMDGPLRFTLEPLALTVCAPAA